MLFDCVRARCIIRNPSSRRFQSQRGQSKSQKVVKEPPARTFDLFLDLISKSHGRLACSLHVMSSHGETSVVAKKSGAYNQCSRGV